MAKRGLLQTSKRNFTALAEERVWSRCCIQYTPIVSNKRTDRSGIRSQVLSAVATAIGIWAIVLALVSRFVDRAAALTTSASIASSLILVGFAAYGVGSWRNQARLRVRHDIAHAAIEASFEALERLTFARNVLAEERESFRGAMERGEPWEPDDKQRLIKDIREVDIALKHLRTAHHLVRIHLDEGADAAMRALVDLAREHTRTTNQHFIGVDRQLPDAEHKHTYHVLFGYDEDNPFTRQLEAAREGLIEALQPFLLSR